MKVFFHLSIAAMLATIVARPAHSADYESEVLADNPLVYLRFEETVGANAVNAGSSGATHDGTYLGGFTLGQTGAITGNASNNAVSLTPSTGRVGINSVVPSSIFSDNSYSVEIWFNQNVLAASQDIVSGVNPNHGILLETTSGGAMRFLHRSPQGGSGGQNINPSSQTYTAQDWHHLVAVVDGGVMELYLDGVPDTGIGPAVSAAINFDIDFVLGRLTPSNSARSFNGLLDEFAVYDQALSSERVLAHFLNAATTAAVPEPTSIAIWTLLGLALTGVGYHRLRPRK